jgi:beta-lactam-binding protein with PASTA domain
VGASSQDVPEGTVMDVNPVGTLQRGTLVTVTYSTGPEPTQSPSMTTVPSGITGQNASAAEQRIKDAGLVPVNGGTQASSQPQGTVVAVNPSEGAPLPEGSTVTYFTSEGPAAVEPAPAPTSAPEPTPTVTSESSVPAAPNGTNPTAG